MQCNKGDKRALLVFHIQCMDLDTKHGDRQDEQNTPERLSKPLLCRHYSFKAMRWCVSTKVLYQRWECLGWRLGLSFHLFLLLFTHAQFELFQPFLRRAENFRWSSKNARGSVLLFNFLVFTSSLCSYLTQGECFDKCIVQWYQAKIKLGIKQPRTQSPQILWSAIGRPTRLWVFLFHRRNLVVKRQNK